MGVVSSRACESESASTQLRDSLSFGEAGSNHLNALPRGDSNIAVGSATRTGSGPANANTACSNSSEAHGPRTTTTQSAAISCNKWTTTSLTLCLVDALNQTMP